MGVPLRIWLLGGFRVEVGDRAVPDATWRRSRARQLVALLALSPAHRLHREQVMDALWPALGLDAASANLRKALHFARRVIGTDQLTVSQSLVRLGASRLWVDVDAFEQAAAAGDTDAALALYGGDLLPEDRYEPWVDRRHDELHRSLIRLLAARANELEQVGDRPAATAMLERLVGADPLNEAAHCDLVRLLALADRRTEALRWYRHLEDGLRDELGVEPGPGARQLYADVCAGRLHEPAGDNRPADVTATGTPLEDRRVVTVLVADVTVTAGADPELHARELERAAGDVRRIVEEGGGAVEARVGNRMVAVFGAPALGDDEARAGAVALRLREEVPVAALGCATGWAIVRDRAPSGERVVGDVVDRAIAAARTPGEGEVPPPPGGTVSGRLVGRAAELRRLDQLWSDVVTTGRLAVALVTGPPGIGKSRLVEEFAGRVDRAAVLTGRCLPGGQDHPLGPMAEIAHRALANRRLDDIELDAGTRAWLSRVLGPVLGDGPDGPDRRQPSEPSEVAAAWLALSVALASPAPSIFVLEDLHWADASTLAFLSRAASGGSEAQLLILGTARPEVFARWPDLPTEVTTLALGPLAPEAVDALLLPGVAAADRAALIARAGGNPLFAVELARLVSQDGVVPTGLPPTIRSVVTARFDALGRLERAVVQAAAVAGDGVTPDELAAMLELDEAAIEAALATLAQREVVRLGPGTVEFVHDVLRDVAADQVTRRTAMRLHRRLADLLAAQPAVPRSGAATRIARHYRHAAAAAKVLKDPQAGELGTLAVRHLVDAGEALERVDLDAALGELDAVMAVSAEEDARVELRRGRMLFALGRRSEASAALSRAVEIARRQGDDATEVVATAVLAEVSWYAGDIRSSLEALRRCAEPLARLPAGHGAAAALGLEAALRALTGDPAGGHALGDRAVATARAGTSARALVRCLEGRGTARVLAGDLGGYDDYVEALDVAMANGLSFEVCELYGDFAALHWFGEGPQASLEFSAKGLDLADRRGLAVSADGLREIRGRVCCDAGRWDEALSLAAMLLDQPAGRLGQAATSAATWAARIHVWRGNVDAAARLAGWALERARPQLSIHVLGPALVTAALVEIAGGDRRATSALLTEFLDVTAGADSYRLMELPMVVRLLLWAGRPDDASAVARLHANWPRARIGLETARALVARATGADTSGALAAAAQRWHRYGAPLEEALARAGAGEWDAATEIAGGLGIDWDDPALPLRALG